ncbi:MAG TPA: TrkA C-terminal domain-containing protein [Euzebyales bacterium]|nr:TrkA C-terminal domain-containing protein [Euzebyales bacterium]
MFQVISLLLVAAVTLLIGRLGTIALTATGLPRPIAKFQARSALSGAGYTTNESESVVSHPARRRIVMTLMSVGSLGSAAIIATLIGSFLDVSGFGSGLERGLQIIVGVFILWMILRIPTLDRVLARVFAGLVKRMTDVDVRDYGNMLRLSSDYGISELLVEAGDWLADRTLAELDLSHEGLLVLGIVRGDHYYGAPKGTYRARPGDTLLVYGPVERLAELDERRSGTAGERAHRDAIVAQREIERLERVAQATETGDEPNLEGADDHGATDAAAAESSEDHNRPRRRGPPTGGGIRRRRQR